MYPASRGCNIVLFSAWLLFCLQPISHAQTKSQPKTQHKAAASIPAVAEDSPSFSVSPQDRLAEAWWAARHKAIVSSLPAHSDAELILLGDSITNNYEKSNPPNEDFQPIWNQYYAPRKALNLGFSGDTTANVLWRLDHGEVAGLHPKAVVLLIGTNDTARGESVEQTEAGIDAVIIDLEFRLPGTKILLLGILPTGLPSMSKDLDINSYLATRYAGGHDSKISFIDIGVIFYAGGALSDAYFVDPSFSPPRPALHPNTLGQRRMASAIEPSLARLLGDTPVLPAQ
jgi:lysophospholipase L1-like esterase